MTTARSKPFAIAHRGASAYAPENTAAAVKLALQLGARAIECDVQLSRDGVPIVFHDDDLLRLCGERGAVARLTAAELTTKRVRVAGRTGKANRILTLARWLALLPRDALAVVELKKQRDARADRQLADAVAPLLRRHRGRVAVISFGARLLRRVHALWPQACTGPVRDRWPDGQARGFVAAAHGVVALAKRIATRTLVAKCARAGQSVWCWTVDEPAEMRALMARGVTGIISNRPDVARATLRELERTRPVRRPPRESVGAPAWSRGPP